jgi:prophage antirepressor-like protein
MIRNDTHLIPHVFTRHKLHLHALLLENQPWFSARDLGRLLRLFLDERTVRKLDPDQHQSAQILIHGVIEDTLLISESGVYALLVYHYCPEYRGLADPRRGPRPQGHTAIAHKRTPYFEPVELAADVVELVALE